MYCERGQTKTVAFTLDKRSFAYYNTEISDWDVPEGRYEILVGRSSQRIEQKAAVEIRGTGTIHRKYDEFVTLGELMQIPAGKQVLAAMNAAEKEQ